MNEKEFISACIKGGYAHEPIAKQYIRESGKDSFTQEDLENAYRLDAKFWNPFETGKFNYYQNTKSTKINTEEKLL